MTKTNCSGWIAAAVGSLFALAASTVRTYYGIWPAVLLFGVIAGATAAIGKWRIYRCFGQRTPLGGRLDH